jgi:hypothetical protein
MQISINSTQEKASHSHKKTGIMDVVQLVKHTKQYLKFYAKALELKHHSTLFYDILCSIY